VGYYRSGIELPPIIHLLPLCLLGRFGLSYPARRRTFQIHNLRAGLAVHSRRHVEAPATASGPTTSVWPTPTHFMLPAFDDPARKFTFFQPGTSAGLRPHFE
jgi:hypothetical protein